MQFTIKKTITRVTVLSALLPTLPWLAADAFAHDRLPPTSKMDPAKAPARGSYAYDSPGAVVRSGVTGECVATGTWSIDTATPDCHPAFFASMKPATTAAAAPPPAAPQDGAAANAQAEPQSTPEPYEAANYVEPSASASAAADDGGANAGAVAAATAATAGGVAGVTDFAGEGDDPDMLAVPAAESFADEGGDDLMLAPIVYGAEDADVADDGIVARQVYDDDAGTLVDDGILARQFYGDDDSSVTEDGIVSRQEYDDAVAAAEDGIVSRQEYDNAVAVADDGIVSRQYDDDSGTAADDGIVSRRTFDDAGAAGDDGIVARQVYDDGDALADDGILGRQELAEEGDEGPDNLIGEPTMFAESPEPVAQAEEPAAASQTKAVVLPVTITLGANALFDFDRSLVRTNDREKLDKLVDGLQGVKYETILVVGHADRIGTETYNQRLSERRAKAVKAYLVTKGLGDERIQTEGRGKMEPVTEKQACTSKARKSLIECLQPDRRVEVTVTGQQPKQ